MNRAELKSQAKGILSANYWPIIGATVLVMAILVAVASVPGIGSIASYFIIPVSLGLTLYTVGLIDGGKPSITDIFTNAFDGRYYLRRVGGYAWMMLFTFLWSLLFVIPGIVKAYSYALTPYILAKYPEVQAKEALKVSMKIMDGKKAELFVLHLSFIGWAMLAGITFGLLGIFFVIPYMAITDTLWFKRTMESAIETGLFSYTPVE
mgnify:FL=1